MSNSWWAQKLGTPQTPVNTPAPAQPTYAYQQYQQQGYQVPAAPPAPPAPRCPNCASGNYGGATPESRPRCYDCGYPITQSGSGMPGVRVQGNSNTEAAKQISTANNFNPGTIVDRIG